MPLILVTRPQPDAARFVEALAARGCEAFVEPLLMIAPVEWRLTSAPGSIILTSRHALPALVREPSLLAIPLYVVGKETAESARELGCAEVTHAPTLAQLKPLLVGLRAPLYLRGREVTESIPGAQEAVVYAAQAAAQFSPALCGALRSGGITAATFFSARTAEIFVELARAAGVAEVLREVAAVAISGRAAAPLMTLAWRAVAVAEFPDAAHMADAAAQAMDNRSA